MWWWEQQLKLGVKEGELEIFTFRAPGRDEPELDGTLLAALDVLVEDFEIEVLAEEVESTPTSERIIQK